MCENFEGILILNVIVSTSQACFLFAVVHKSSVIDEKTAEESTSGTEADEDNSAVITNINDYSEIFQPSRARQLFIIVQYYVKYIIFLFVIVSIQTKFCFLFFSEPHTSTYH